MNPRCKVPLMLFVIACWVIAGWKIVQSDPGSGGTEALSQKTKRLLYVAVPGVRNYLEYGGHGILVYDVYIQHNVNGQTIACIEWPFGRP